MQARTIIDHLEIDLQNGHMFLRLLKQVQADNGEIISSRYHRSVLNPGGSPSTVLADTNAQLAAQGFPNIASADVTVLNTVVTALASWRATKAAEQP